MDEFNGACVDCGQVPEGKVRITSYKGGVVFPFGVMGIKQAVRFMEHERNETEALAWFDSAQVGHYVKRRQNNKSLCGGRVSAQ